MENELAIISTTKLLAEIEKKINSALMHHKIISKEKRLAEDEEFISAKEVCRLLKISKPTLYKRMKDGVIPFKKLGKRLLFPKNLLLQQFTAGSKEKFTCN